MAELRREDFPKSLEDWRLPFENREDYYFKLWGRLEQHFMDTASVKLWEQVEDSVLESPALTPPNANGFVKVHPASAKMEVDSFDWFTVSNALKWIARDSHGHDVVIRVIKAGDEGQTQVDILQDLAMGPKSLLASNIVLPMFQKVDLFDDIAFGIFPKTGFTMDVAFNISNGRGTWPKNSIYDLIDLILQALTGIAFVHGQGIVHRDLFVDNFLLDYQPESLNGRCAMRPRVYLIDFEYALRMPSNCSRDDFTITGVPVADEATYKRPRAPEMSGDKPYSPFALDIWQFGWGLQNFKTSAPLIDKTIDSLMAKKPDKRPDAQGALEKLRNIVDEIPPKQLHREPVTH